MQEPENAYLTAEIAARVAALGQSERLILAEIGDNGITVWTIGLDRAGTPSCASQGPVPWSRLAPDGTVSEAQLSQLIEVGALLIVVRTGAEGPAPEQAADWYRDVFPHAAAYRVTADLSDLLREALAELPLAQWYELVTLETNRAGRPLLTPLPLFPPGAQRGFTSQVRIRCEDSDENGTVFAVVAREAEQYSLVSAHSARVRPGDYMLTARLVRPGVVRFEGIQEPLRRDTRSWPEIIATIPDRIESAADPVHLIFLIEVTSPAERAHERVDLAHQVAKEVIRAVGDRLSVSLISYGSHAVDRYTRDERPVVWAWEAPAVVGDDVLSELRTATFAAEDGYHRAAQLEDALAEVARRLSGLTGRPVLVAVGSRPPFPPKVDPFVSIIPCPNRYDWRQAALRLREHNGITFGAIRDEPDDYGTDSADAWQLLGSHAVAQPGDLDPRRFAADLGLLSRPVQHVPLPLVDSPGA